MYDLAQRPFPFSQRLQQVQAALEEIQKELRPDLASIPQEVSEIVEHIHDHLFEPTFNVNTLRAHCRLRNNNVSTRFRKVVGVGIREYIEGLRLEAASYLLRRMRCEVYLAAMAVGYCHEETFCRAFHRKFQRTPSASRVGREEEETSRMEVKKQSQEQGSNLLLDDGGTIGA